MHVVTVVGTRPEIIKLSRVMHALDKTVQHTVIHTGQNYDRELNQVFFEEMNVRKPDYVLETDGSIPLMFATLQDLLTRLKPDALLILGDTNSCFAAAYVATRLKIPLFHMEAGNRCFDFRTTEEVNRKLIDHMPGIQMPYSDLARENLMREGIPTDRAIKTGSPMNEVLCHYESDINASEVLPQLHLTPREYFVVSVHREENVDGHFHGFMILLREIAAKYRQRIIVTTHPRTRKRLDAEYRTASPLVEFHKPFGLFDYVKLQQNARCTLSDSGTISEESSILGFPALNLRESHERPEASEEANVIMTGFSVQRVMESLPIAKQITCTPDDYCPLNVSDKVVRTILSHTDYINRRVWHK